jgi:antitoxin Phd
METERCMTSWPVQDAKARFSELLATCLRDGPQVVTRRGAEAAVLVPAEDWRRLQAAARPTLKELLLTDEARADIPVPPRGHRRRRAPEPPG